jgi:anaerobic selenocysteine-containing dehydrogenase
MTTGTGLNFTSNSLVAQWLRWVIIIITGSVDHEGGMWVNAGWFDPLEKRDQWQPAPETARPQAPPSRQDLPMWLGEVPCAAMIDQIESGHLKALFINGGSPLTAFPEPDRMLAALRSLELLAVVDVMSNELTDMATHVLPAAALLERSDMPGGWSHHMAYAPQLVPLGEDRRKTWWIFAELGRRMGLDVLDGFGADATTDDDLLKRSATNGRRAPEELMAAGPRGMMIPRPYGWVHERALPDGKWRLVPEVMIERLPAILEQASEQRDFRLVSGRELHNHNRMAYGRYGYKRFSTAEESATVGIHPSDAESIGLKKGDLVEIKGEAGSVTAALRIDDTLNSGTLHLTHGWVGTNVCHLAGREIDPQTGQPTMMSAIPVDVLRAS